VRDAPFDITWCAIQSALYVGMRGLPGRSSLPQLLAEHRGVMPPTPLTVDTILAWADAHHARTGEWPADESGAVTDAPYHVTWRAVRSAVERGQRGLPGGASFRQLLAEHRGVKGPLTLERVLAWADAHRASTGRWPTVDSGKVAGTERENWRQINVYLRHGGRGLPGGQSLARVLAEHRGLRNMASIPPLSIAQILAWADAHHAATGAWPNNLSGPVLSAPGETWEGISSALRISGRGLACKTSLGRLLIEHRGPAAHNRSPTLTVQQVLAWADAHRAATGRWPSPTTGAVAGAPGESWRKIQSALRKGQRGLPGGWTLARLLAHHRGDRRPSVVK
jgi:hypothetical protein